MDACILYYIRFSHWEQGWTIWTNHGEKTQPRKQHHYTWSLRFFRLAMPFRTETIMEQCHPLTPPGPWRMSKSWRVRHYGFGSKRQRTGAASFPPWCVCVVPGARGFNTVTSIYHYLYFRTIRMVTRAKYIAGKYILKSSTCLHNWEAIIMTLLQLRVQVLTTGLFIPVDIMLMESRQIHFFRRLLQLRAPGVSWLIYIRSLEQKMCPS